MLEAKVSQLQEISHTDALGAEHINAALDGYVSVLKACGDILVKLKRAGIGEETARVTRETGQMLVRAVQNALNSPELKTLDYDDVRLIGRLISENMAKLEAEGAA